MIRLFPWSPLNTLLAVGVVVVSALTLLRVRRGKTHGHRLPPGPVPLPLVGNFLSIDAKQPWLTYAKWGIRYGDIFMIRVLKQNIIVINSKKIAKDLLERRSSIYSDRPRLSTVDPLGWNFHFAWAPYGDKWRSQRRIFHQAFRAEAATVFYPAQLRKVHQLILDMINNPDDFHEHIQRFSAALIMSMVYDYEVTTEHDPLVETIERGSALGMEFLTPEASSIIDAFPILLRLPGWFPGATMKRKLIVSQHYAKRMVTEPFEHALKREAMGSRAPAVALDSLRAMKDLNDPLQIQLLKETCAAAFVGGAETSTSTMLWFVLVMRQHPEVQERAQAEIDAVVGPDRLPSFDDRPNLPYVEAILLEILRMHAVAPLGISHATTADDIYDGFFIPKGTTVVTNIWAMHRDEETYPEPNVFKPERFFVDGTLTKERAVDSIAYGFGRRMCPGRYAADSTVWAAIVTILAVFRITKARNERGEEILCDPIMRSGVTFVPEPFPCSVKLRSSDVDIKKLLMLDSFD